MPETRRRRLIEVAFPLEEVSEHSRREKNVRHGHISTLHIWWARRPLAACRAFIYASLVDDPGEGPEREELLKEVADLASWDAVRKPDQVVRPREKGGSGLTGRQLLERARQRILDCNGGKPPRLLDPFAGGGAIPLEALRLGCEVEASDLNPVAVLILKGTVEYPQKYGQPNSRDVPKYIYLAADSGPQKGFFDGDLVAAYKKNPLATDVRYWGNWMLERARQELAQFYPPDPDGSVPVAYLWSRTVPCPNCGAEMPLIRQYWLARKDRKKVALRPVLDRAHNRVDFEVVEGPDVTGDPAEATTTRGDTVCLLCRQVAKGETIRRLSSEGKMGAALTAVVLEGRGGKRYRADRPDDMASFAKATQELHERMARHSGDLSLVPDEPMPDIPDLVSGRGFGIKQWWQLFNARQLLALTTFARLVREAHAEMLACGLDADYAKAVATYLGLAVDKAADFGSTLCRLNAEGGRGVVDTFARQALPMVWDYAESNPFCTDGAGWISYLSRSADALDGLGFGLPTAVRIRDVREPRAPTLDSIITDPPYYDAINYADLSDFFYVWLKRSVGALHTDLLSLPLTPKRDQVVMNVYANGNSGGDRRAQAHRHYVKGMAQAFAAMRKSLIDGGLVGVVFAHTDPDAWSTIIEGLLGAGLVPDASWPLDTEREARVSGLEQARLATSVWMACRPRHEDAGEAFLADVMAEMRPVIRERLLYFWSKGIRGADFFISAIGPALSVFGRYEKVMRPDGTEVTVRDFLDLVRRESTTVALEQVLHGADLGLIDPVTRQYVTWVWSYSRAPLEAGEAIALCLATGADYGQVVRPHAIAAESREKSKKLVKLRSIRERGAQDEDLGIGTPARPAPLIDQLQRTAWLWGQNKPQELAKYRVDLGETRWQALRTLGQAVAECLPDGDEDRRLVNGLLSSSVMSAAVPAAAASRPSGGEERRLPGV
ncbi:MAG TPA: DUF1156 domain-containing protein [Dehalococcoidia bacterium]|nr:DUF1156 domain-containing protein [Dehalococcoidia bacterium]